ncbi:hypothetical protein [Leifsonia virtsii]|uniref:DUF58 domain-containing protein n=1 Tax=Leifsonia virtsii TaxID=3035915 RepID=A0ABT8J1E5_9MICO|nr:hypothetical protein [Leifsonia virtsii]MDN4598905.1 hypothetical protein [Leifsonia virtsii]
MKRWSVWRLLAGASVAGTVIALSIHAVLGSGAAFWQLLAYLALGAILLMIASAIRRSDMREVGYAIRSIRRRVKSKVWVVKVASVTFGDFSNLRERLGVLSVAGEPLPYLLLTVTRGSLLLFLPVHHEDPIESRALTETDLSIARGTLQIRSADGMGTLDLRVISTPLYLPSRTLTRSLYNSLRYHAVADHTGTR